MKKCEYCGAEIDNNSKFCSNCGGSASSNNESQKEIVIDANTNTQKNTSSSDTSIVGKVLGGIGLGCSALSLIFGSFLAFAGIVLGIIGLCIDKTKKSKGINIASIIVGIVLSLFSILIVFLFGGIFSGLFAYVIDFITSMAAI